MADNTPLSRTNFVENHAKIRENLEKMQALRLSLMNKLNIPHKTEDYKNVAENTYKIQLIKFVPSISECLNLLDKLNLQMQIGASSPEITKQNLEAEINSLHNKIVKLYNQQGKDYKINLLKQCKEVIDRSPALSKLSVDDKVKIYNSIIETNEEYMKLLEEVKVNTQKLTITLDESHFRNMYEKIHELCTRVKLHGIELDNNNASSDIVFSSKSKCSVSNSDLVCKKINSLNEDFNKLNHLRSYDPSLDELGSSNVFRDNFNRLLSNIDNKINEILKIVEIQSKIYDSSPIHVSTDSLSARNTNSDSSNSLENNSHSSSSVSIQELTDALTSTKSELQAYNPPQINFITPS